MQAIKEKLSDMNEMRKAKAEAREEEKAEKEMAKARMEVAREVRLAKEAEAAMDLHVNKAAGKAAEHERKHGGQHHHPGSGRSGGQQDLKGLDYSNTQDSDTNSSAPLVCSTTDRLYENEGRDSTGTDSTASIAGSDYSATRSGGALTNNLL